MLFCIDGNKDDSLYMKDIFADVFCDEKVGFFRWDYNYHELPLGVGNDANGVDALLAMIRTHRVVCIMQKWGGKRHVMYT